MHRHRPDLHGKVVAITGGARGIGAATARTLVQAGARVAVGDLDLPPTPDVAGEPLGINLDVTDPASFTAFLDQVEATLGPIDVLINNAGIMVVVEFELETPASVKRQIDVNLHAVIHGS